MDQHVEMSTHDYINYCKEEAKKYLVWNFPHQALNTLKFLLKRNKKTQNHKLLETKIEDITKTLN